MPRPDVLRAVVAALEEAGVTAALGGSGLLAALGLVDRVRDWDVTTDAAPARVEAALTARGVPFEVRAAGDERYATRARLRIDGGDHDVDLIVGFAVRTGDAVVDLPTRVSDHWHGVPLADPQVWALAYRLIGRPEKAALLDGWIGARTPPVRPGPDDDAG